MCSARHFALRQVEVPIYIGDGVKGLELDTGLGDEAESFTATGALQSDA